ncbi:MAG: DUF1214 domain-containing protein [Planctomycetaceae bacterium]
MKSRELIEPKQAQRIAVGRPDDRNRYYKDRQYENTWAGGTSEWLQNTYLDVNQRACYFQFAYSTAPAMVMRTLDAGSKYPFTTRDADGKFLDGSNNYKLHLPPDPPAALFWAVTAYNITDGTMPETPQLLPSINGSVGKSALIASLTGHTAYASNFRGSTVSVHTYHVVNGDFVDTPGILFQSDSETTRLTLSELDQPHDRVLVVVKATNLDQDLTHMLLLVVGMRGADKV